MVSQQLHLSWKDHNGTLISDFETLLKKNILVDCTLAAEGQYLKAHKMVLSACSSYFELLFSQENEKNPIVILKDVGFQELKAVVNFMYTGEVEVYDDRLSAFLEVADSLQIKGLKCDRNNQQSQDNSLLVEISSSKSVMSPCQQPREEEFSVLSESPSIPANCELVKNIESCSDRQSSPSESSSSSSTLRLATSFSQNGQDICGDESTLDKFQSSLVALPHCLSGENEQSDIDPAVKNEPSHDTYEEEEDDVVGMDFEDGLLTKEDQEIWDKQHEETKNNEQSTNQQDDGVKYRFEPIVPINQGKTRSSTKLYLLGTTGSDPGDVISPARMKSSLQPQECQQSEEGKLIWNHSLIDLSSSLNLEQSVLIKNKQLHKCPYCDFLSKWKSNLTIHLRTHSGERPYKCPHCNFASKTTSDRKRHIRSHTGEKPYKCSECNYKSNQYSHLKIHLRIHSGEKPYCCPFCDYRASHSSSILWHKRRHHSNEK